MRLLPFARRRRELRLLHNELRGLRELISDERIAHRSVLLQERSRFAECDLRRKRQTERRAMYEKQAILWEKRARRLGWDGPWWDE